MRGDEKPVENSSSLLSHSFPKDFEWGVATSAYQIEGAVQEDGRGVSIWDVFAHTPGNVLNGETGDVACDSYHRVDEDLALIEQLGVSLYRFSIAWPRIIPDGDGEVNVAGLAYYDRLVDGLLARGIKPVCTLYHWDLPQALQEKGGWERRETAVAFARYARIVFEHFEGRIPMWLTINEPWCVAFLSHQLGHHAPGKKDMQVALGVAHHVLLAHGLAVQAFRAGGFSGAIGIAPNTEWFAPATDAEADVAAAARRNAYINDWFLEPIFKGQYPHELMLHYERRGYAVPIHEGDMQLICSGIDWLGVNYYTGGVVRHCAGHGELDLEELRTDWAKTDFDWNIYPQGLTNVLIDIQRRYSNLPIYITENGACYEVQMGQAITADPMRIGYLRLHLKAVLTAIQADVSVQGYMCWSLMDNFEWAMGYSKRFGLVHVDFTTLVRTPKDSYWWYRDVIRYQGFVVE